MVLKLEEKQHEKILALAETTILEDLAMPLGYARKRLLTAPYQPVYVSTFDIIVRLGLYQNLKLCLDAGSLQSAPASPTKWLDLSGSGADFFLGNTAGAEASDPIFNGNPGGLSSREYWAFDNAKYFTYDAANESWMQNLHKNNAVASFITWAYFTSYTSPPDGFCGTDAAFLAQTGFFWRERINGSGQEVVVVNGSGTSAYSNAMFAGDLPLNTWHFFAVSIDEANNAIIQQVNDVVKQSACTYTNPSAGNATNTFQVAGGGGNSGTMNNGSRMAMFAAWDRALAAHEITNIYEATRVRFERT